MGCDIHIHSEVMIAGKWEHYDQPECSRDYELFERMAGVRGDVENAIAQPRGIPDNASVVTKFDCANWDVDGHSHSWLSSQEVFDLAKWDSARGNDRHERKWDRWLFGGYYSSFIEYPEERTDGVEDFRFVFWFDN